MPAAVTSNRVVIVGGGYGGSALAYTLQGSADVTLIDNKNFLEHVIGNPRALVDPSFTTKSLIPHSSYLKTAKVVVGTVQGVSSSSSGGTVTVVLPNGTTTEVPFDFLVLSTGTSYALWRPDDVQLEDRRQKLKGYADEIAKANRIVIVGGGATGVETAAEIVETFPSKKITLVTNANTLLVGASTKAQKFATDFLTKRNVELIFNEKVSSPGGTATHQKQTLKTTGGKTLDADIVLWSVGIGKPNTDFLKAGPLASALDSNGFVKIDPTLQVTGVPNVFAIGDIAALSDPKLAFAAKLHAQVVAANIKKLIKDPKAALKSHKPPPAVGLVTLGKNNGVMYTPWFTTTGFLPRKFKSADMFVGQSRKDLGIK